jgi:uncharacterized membrane protein
MWFAFLLPILFTWCVVDYFRNKNDKFLYQWRRAIGWLALCVFPITLVAVVARMLEDGGVEWDKAATVVFAPIHWIILIAGQTVISVFEENVKDWTGHRRDTMADNTEVFVLMLLIQLAVLSWFVALRFRKGKTWRDPLVCGVGIFMAVNAFLAMDWPWYGT